MGVRNRNSRLRPAAHRPQHKLSLIKRGFDFFWAVFKNNSLEVGPYGLLRVHSPWAKFKDNTLELSPYALRPAGRYFCLHEVWFSILHFSVSVLTPDSVFGPSVGR